MTKTTFLNLAERILREEGRPLCARAIWIVALKKGYHQSVKTNGKTPWNSIGARLYTDIKKNSNTPFEKVSRGEFSLKGSNKASKNKTSNKPSIKTQPTKKAVTVISKRKEQKEKYEIPVLTPEQKVMIPMDHFAKTYLSRRIGDMSDMELLKRAYGAKKFVMIFGPTGCGKDHCVLALGATLKVPVYSANLNGSTTVEDLIGQLTLKDHSTIWVDGMITRALREGGIVVLDEVNAAAPEVLFALHQITDDRRELILTGNDCEVIKAHKDFWLACTLNLGYEGTRDLNEAFKDRFLWIKFNYNNRADTKFINEDAKLRDLVKTLRELFARGELIEPCSTRTIKNFQESRELYGDKVAKEKLLAISFR